MKKVGGGSKKISRQPKADVAHYNAILLEDVRHKLETVIESTQITRIELKQEMKTLREDLSGRIDLVEGALRHHSVAIQKLNTEVKDLRKDTGDLRKEMGKMNQELQEEMHGMEQRLSTKLSGNTTRLADHEERITALEEISQPNTAG